MHSAAEIPQVQILLIPEVTEMGKTHPKYITLKTGIFDSPTDILPWSSERLQADKLLRET